MKNERQLSVPNHKDTHMKKDKIRDTVLAVCIAFNVKYK